MVSLGEDVVDKVADETVGWGADLIWQVVRSGVALTCGLIGEGTGVSEGVCRKLEGTVRCRRQRGETSRSHDMLAFDRLTQRV
jgi:hypothetical protein